jgi:hypothetical protein
MFSLKYDLITYCKKVSLFMSIIKGAGKFVNFFLIKFGYKIVALNRKSKLIFPEEQLLKALSELSSLYRKFLFNSDFVTDEECLKILANSMYTKFGTGFHLIYHLRQSLSLNGDVCEFGVAQGAISALLANEIKKTDKNLWLFDSFETRPLASEKNVLGNDIGDSGTMEYYKGSLSFPEDMVRSRLSEINFPPDRIKIVPGYIQKTIHGDDLPQDVCFAYVDLNYYQPVLIALDFLDTVLQPGGFMIIDDYDFVEKGVKKAVDEFYNARKEKYTIKFPVQPEGKICILGKNN